MSPVILCIDDFYTFGGAICSIGKIIGCLWSSFTGLTYSSWLELLCTILTGKRSEWRKLKTSIILQDVVREGFKGLKDDSGNEDWIVVLFDNLLIMANDPKEMADRVEKFLDRCIELNMRLKLSKSNIGHKTVTFFGYEVTKDGYQLGRDREEVLQSIPMPTTVKEMQSFLGVTVFFAKFVPL